MDDPSAHDAHLKALLADAAALADHRLMRVQAARPQSAGGAQVEPAAHEALLKALWADTAFLAGQGVMDYSLLVGVDSPNGALVVGIIDFLRQVRGFPTEPCWAVDPARGNASVT